MANTVAPHVTVIDPIIPIDHPELFTDSHKLRVAAYARVSTEQEEQQNSYMAQVRYYTAHIQNNPEWEFAGIYSDEGISGTSRKNRDGFNQMMKDAEAGKIDMILVKSISRFARNTKDTLEAIRDLKKQGVSVFFEKEHINTSDSQGEILLTTFSSMAQQESLNISENVRWGKQKSMMDGKVSLAYSHFHGYRKGADGRLEIVPEQAKVVVEIFDLYLKDTTLQNIAKHLTAKGYKTPAGKDVWSVSTVRSILSNEKYKGDALLQKTYTVDYLTKEVKKNEGERKQYYITNSHPAIIDPEIFDLVQVKLAENSKNKSKISNNSPFTTKIICGDCGGFFGRKVYHSNDKYRTVAWCCNQKYYDNHVCETPRIREDDIKAAFMDALRQVIAGKGANKAPCALDGPEADEVADRLKKAREGAVKAQDKAIGELRELINDNARRSQDQAIFRERYEQISKKVEEHKQAVKLAEEAIISNTARKAKLRRFMDATSNPDILSEFTDELVSDTLEGIIVSKAKGTAYTLQFIFTNEATITIEMSKPAYESKL